MQNTSEIKSAFNKLISEDKKHIKFFENKFQQFEYTKMAGSNFYFIVDNKYYVVHKHHEVKYDFEKSFQNSEREVVEKPTFETYFIRTLNALLNYEDNNCSSWIVNNIDYLKNKVKDIYDKNKTCHIYQFKKVSNPKNNSYNKYITF